MITPLKHRVFNGCLALTFLAFLVIIYDLHRKNAAITVHTSATTAPAAHCRTGNEHKLYSGEYKKKTTGEENRWIVVTTIFAPTDCIRFMSTIPDWHMVVVADKKTPLDWNVTGVHFLSMQKQQEMSLRFKTIELLPWANYGRKNIGFLYAIQQGATVMYEIDDDNCPDVPKMIYLPEYDSYPTVVPVSDTENIYAHFGQQHVWQRGAPITAIQKQFKQFPSTHSNQNKQWTPFQQALADNDPDVDAIYRLTQPLPVFFDRAKGPIVLPMGTFSPTNSQNTISYYGAFWATLLPISPSPRVTDIWRGYWNQLLMWDIGAQQLFMPPTVIQLRTPQSYLANFRAETQLYEQTPDLVTFLKGWCSIKPTLPERMIDLAMDMERNKFWDASDVALMRAWVQDLISLDYKWPNIKTIIPTKCPERTTKEAKVFVRQSYFTLSYADYRGS